MPAARYEILGEDGEAIGVEDLRCAPGPVGWRSFSQIEIAEPPGGQHHETVDVVVDAQWRPVRLRIDTGEHQLLLEAAGDVLAGARDRERVEIAWGPDHHLDYRSPSFNAVTCMRLTATADIDVVFVQPFTLTPTMRRQRYEPLGDEEVDTPAGRFAAVRWRFTSLPDGWTGDLWVAAEVVVAFDGAYRMTRYEEGASGPRRLT